MRFLLIKAILFRKIRKSGFLFGSFSQIGLKFYSGFSFLDYFLESCFLCLYASWLYQSNFLIAFDHLEGFLLFCFFVLIYIFEETS